MGLAVSSEALGRVVDVFGTPLDNKGAFKRAQIANFEREAPALIDRVRVSENLETGVTLVDILIPIGRGQRQLVLGDQKVGKTSFLISAIARQAQLGAICVYCAIGKKKSDLSAQIARLAKLGAMEKTVVVAAPSSTPASQVYLAPYAAMTLAEFFRDMGKNVLLVLDEISTHAAYFRELSIISRRMPGREGYPGDIFYTHAHILERAGRFLIEKSNKGNKGDEETLALKIGGRTASITCLPVVETMGSDFTGYISTNLMSMTDGHIFFDVSKFQEGMRPAVNAGLSVTRVGKQTQNSIERDFAQKAKKIIFAYQKAQGVAKFGVELHQATRDDIVLGEKLNAILEQRSDVLVPKVIQLLFLELLLSGFWQNTPPLVVREYKEKILDFYWQGKICSLAGQLVRAISSGLARKFSKTVAQNLGTIAKICSQNGT